MPDPYIVVRGDLEPPISGTIRQANKKPLPLGGCQLRFIMVPAPGLTAPTINQPADIVDEARGRWEYVWQPGDTDVVGVYRAEVQVTLPNGRPRTSPTDGPMDIEIRADLGD